MQSSLLVAAGLGGPERPAYDLVLRPGDTLVMYSDGLIERRSELITVGMQRLADAATAVATGGWPERAASELATRLGDDETADDVVVLALRYLGPPAGDTGSALVGTEHTGMSTLHLEPIVESTPTARHWIAEQLRDVPAEVSECAALLTSELVTNAVLHAATPFTVTLHLMADRIRVDVADSSPVAPSLKDYATDAATGRGLTLFNTLASDWGVQPVMGGKIVWFELPVDYVVVPEGVSDGAFRFDLIGVAQAELHDGADTQPLVPVHLIGVPVRAAPEGQRGVRSAVPRAPPHEGARRGEPVRPPGSADRASLRDRDAVQRSRARRRRGLAGGRRSQGGDLRLALRAARSPPSAPACSTTPCWTKRTNSAWWPSCSPCRPRPPASPCAGGFSPSWWPSYAGSRRPPGWRARCSGR